MVKQEQCKVIHHREIAPSIYELTLAGELVKQMNEPGQFVHIKVSDGLDPLLRRPISIASIQKEKGQFIIIYRADGHGTQLLSKKQCGEFVDVLGPLGNGFPINEVKQGETALIIGGGVGVPPLYELSKQLVEKKVNVIHIFGFQTKEAVFYEDKFAMLGETQIATVDGSLGSKGFVTDVIDQIQPSFVTAYACGPTPMLQALQSNFVGEKLFISLEQRMGCGIGACFACVCQTKHIENHTYKKICSDGPVFRAEEVVLR